ncbi:MAG TPA: hypothetical protein PKD85_16960, partial [Saprospiraceae bacterium]|nr:hypothetical protein [Saprospiraceae bacterium]
MEEYDKSKNVKSLIALWAFSESGLGGLLHALKLPLTGITVGSIAVLCIALISWYSNFNKRTLLAALSVVLLVKVTVSPHSPWAAYVAVTFQGFMGILLLNYKESFKISVLIFAILCLFESAVQRILILFLVYGNQFILSVDQAATQLAKQLGISSEISMVQIGFAIYVFLHLFVGVLIGVKIPNFIQSLQRKVITLGNSDISSTSSL